MARITDGFLKQLCRERKYYESRPELNDVRSSSPGGASKNAPALSRQSRAFVTDSFPVFTRIRDLSGDIV